MSEDIEKNVPERLLDAAEKLFCEKGYEETSVRDLTNEAKCNIASVNYHFGGKDKLYIEMFKRHFAKMIKVQTQNINEVMSSDNPSLEMLIAKLVETALEPLRNNKPEKSMLKLLIRENLNPQMPQELLPHEMYSDLEQKFIGAIIELTPGISQKDAVLSRFSVDGVITFSLIFTEYYFKIFPDMSLDDLCDHIVKFTCSGIRGFARDNT